MKEGRRKEKDCLKSHTRRLQKDDRLSRREQVRFQTNKQNKNQTKNKIQTIHECSLRIFLSLRTGNETNESKESKDFEV